MFGFYIKKAFFDGWDNFLQILLQNLLYVLLIILELGGITLFGGTMLGFYGFTAFVVFLCCVLLGGTASAVKNYTDYKSETWGPIWKGIRRNIGHSVLLFLVLVVLFVICTVAMPFYLSLDNFLGTIGGLLMFWVVLFTLFALPFYFPLMNLLPGDKPTKTLKKCYIVAFDNLGYAFLLLLHNLVDLALTIFTLGLFTGVTGIMLGSEVMGKLLMKKYDWQEENPGRPRNEMDWDELLYEEKESVGPRSLKTMIFPWR